MNYKKLAAIVDNFKDTGKDASDLNSVRTKIFDSLDEGSITETEKNSLLKELYTSATKKKIFFLRVTERTKPTPEPEEDDCDYEESYEESYSYEDEEEEE